ncbi:MAG: DUF3158 family protein [Shinella sp.]|nr:DUF3158 family protein [Shinella sp.]
MTQSNYFMPLEQTAYQALEQIAYLKGLLKPFKGKGSLEDWASRCSGLRDDLITLAERRILPQARNHPFSRLPVQLALQTTGAGTTFLRWRNADRSRMGVKLWEELVSSTATPPALIPDLLAMEEQRVIINMQVSLLHSMVRQALECAGKLERAEDVAKRRAAEQLS